MNQNVIVNSKYSNAGPRNPQNKFATTFGSKKENVMLQFVRLEN